ncbi:MAG: zinc-ribbon domain-containing protein, partial [Gammaproteobacteria bacterium]|nr:zinc-ribbon domain-containing protein [Gammaproteobacteria bacterium]
MYTQCPNCQSIFGLTEDQIRVRQGLVRCGACKEVFNATWNLIDSISATGTADDATPKAPTANRSEPRSSPQAPAADNTLDDDDSNVLLTSPPDSRPAYFESGDSRRGTDSLVAATHQPEVSPSESGNGAADAGTPTVDSTADAAEDDRYEFEFEHSRTTVSAFTGAAESAASPSSADDDDDEFEFEFEFGHSEPRRLLTPTVAESAPTREVTPAAAASGVEPSGAAPIARQPAATILTAPDQPSPIAQQPDPATGAEILSGTPAGDEPDADYRNVSANSVTDDYISIPVVGDEFSLSSGATGHGIVPEVNFASEGFAVEYDVTGAGDADHDLGVTLPDLPVAPDVAVEYDDDGVVYRNLQHDTTPFDVNSERVDTVQPSDESAALTVGSPSFLQSALDELERIEEVGLPDKILGLAPEYAMDGTLVDDEIGIFEDTDSYDVLDFDNAPSDDVILHAKRDSTRPLPAGLDAAPAEAPTRPVTADAAGTADEELQLLDAFGFAITESVVVDSITIDTNTDDGTAPGPAGASPISEADRDASNVNGEGEAATVYGFNADYLPKGRIDEPPIDGSPQDAAMDSAEEQPTETVRDIEPAIAVAAADAGTDVHESAEGDMAGFDGQPSPSKGDIDSADASDEEATDASSDIDEPTEEDITTQAVVDSTSLDAKTVDVDDALSPSEVDGAVDNDVIDALVAETQFDVDDSVEHDEVEQFVAESQSTDATHTGRDDELPTPETSADGVAVSEAASDVEAAEESFEFDESSDDGDVEAPVEAATGPEAEVEESDREPTVVEADAAGEAASDVEAAEESFEFDESSDDGDVEAPVEAATGPE